MDPLLIALLLALALPLGCALLMPFCVRFLRSSLSWTLSLIPLTCFLLITWVAWKTADQPQVVVGLPWVPSLGVNLTFLIDGLSLFFGLIVTGIGTLIFFYARAYFQGDHETPLGRFYAYLLLFMVAMLGTVFAGNLISLFIFWELTGIASFLLIGFSHDKESSRSGARMALLITGLTGLIMLIGIIMLGLNAQTWDLAPILNSDFSQYSNSPWFNAALVLIFLGAMGKSAQFPFHFWLPNAMAAPTPVSAYLHSATMVKLGVFLCARIFPIFHDATLWFTLLCSIGFGTMLLAAWMALRSHDLKAILAFSTVSQLGFLIGFYGLGSSVGVRFDFVHIMSHACYKACLFMIVGIIDHSCGVRDIRQLGGLWKKAPWLGGACLIACASMAGIPGTIGFISKELMLIDLFAVLHKHGASVWLLLLLVLIASILKIAFSARIFLHLFRGSETETVRHHWHAPSAAIQVPPLILATLILTLGFFPGLLDHPLRSLHVLGLHDKTGADLALWHGFTKELVLSLSLVALGALLYSRLQAKGWKLEIPLWARFDLFFEKGIHLFNSFTKKSTALLSSDQPLHYIPIILITLLTFMAFPLAAACHQWGPEILAQTRLWQPDLLRSLTVLFILISACGLVTLKRWPQQLLCLSAIGFLVTLYFILYRAPDLALTQILIESALILMILLLLARFPRQAYAAEHRPPTAPIRKVLPMLVALSSGLMVTLFLLLASVKNPDQSIGSLYLEQALPLAKGSNAVNTIIIDFRSLDTLGEISVLLIAVLAAIGLIMRYRRTPHERTQAAHGPAGFGLPSFKNKELP